MTKAFSVFLVLVLVIFTMSACSNAGGSSDNSSQSAGSELSAEESFLQDETEMFTERDLDFDYNQNECVTIELLDSKATASSDSVKISGSTVTVTKEAIYIVSGNLDNGMIIVDADDSAKVRLVFNGVNINSESSAALYVYQADKVIVTLAEDTENTLSNGGTFTDIDGENIDAAIYSKQDLTLNGTGLLNISSPSEHGVVCKDDLVITGGKYNITSASDGIDANDSVRICGETVITVDAGKDGIHAENSEDADLGYVYILNGEFNIEAEGDGISSGAYMQIAGGTFNILAGGGSSNGSKQSSDSWGGFMGGGHMGMGRTTDSTQTTDENSTSMKGIKSVGSMVISQGEFIIDSADDAVHSDVSIKINGGEFEIKSGDDAFHAENNLSVVSGKINIIESYEGLEALDIDIQGGDIKLVASDDGINAAGGTDSSGVTGGRDGMFDAGPGGKGGMGGMSSSSNGTVVISGGTLYINSSGDGIDANGSIEILDGNVTIVGPTYGDTATLDYDTSAVIKGGTFIGTGASGMAQTFSSSAQGVVAVSVGSQSEGTEITLINSKGDVVISYSPELSYQVVIFSSPDIVSGETYTIKVGSTSGEVKAN